MRVYLNAGFGELLGQETLDLIRGLGFFGVRQDVTDPAKADALCGEFTSSALHPIFLVAGGKMGRDGRGTAPQEIAAVAEEVARAAASLGLFERDPPAAIEIGNEPDIAWTYDRDPERFAQAVREATRRVKGVSPAATVISGGIANTGKHGLGYLARAIQAGLPAECAVGYHSYRTTTAPTTPHDGFASRDAELQRLKQIAGPRPIWCTETGWHTAPSNVKKGWFGSQTVQFNDTQVADFVAQEAQIHARNGAVAFVVFQLNDGPDPKAYEHRFGMRQLDGQLKPVALRIRDVAIQVA